MAAVFSFPMRMDGTRLGAADLYLDKPGRLAPEDAAIGQVLADVAAAYIANARGRVESEQTEEALRYRTLHDPLTGLPNRTLLYDRVAQAITKARRERAVPAVLFIDLDGFKMINDNLGHPRRRPVAGLRRAAFGSHVARRRHAGSTRGR